MRYYHPFSDILHSYFFQPYDEDYLKSKDIKHMSFHAHVRKLTSGHGKGSQVKRPLENIRYAILWLCVAVFYSFSYFHLSSCAINLNCPAHKPYPKGVCTKCKPPMMTLNRQVRLSIYGNGLLARLSCIFKYPLA